MLLRMISPTRPRLICRAIMAMLSESTWIIGIIENIYASQTVIMSVRLVPVSAEVGDFALDGKMRLIGA